MLGYATLLHSIGNNITIREGLYLIEYNNLQCSIVNSITKLHSKALSLQNTVSE